MDTSGWEDPDPADLLLLVRDEDWNRLANKYDPGPHSPFRRCLEVARAGGATTVVIETRYIDIDYRSEYSAFYSRTFASVPDSAHRLHFFRATLQPTQLWKLPADHGYLGYCVIRPSDLGPVGRTVLEPPPGVLGAIQTAITDRVNFFGQELTVTGVPFVQQDTQLGRCAHAAAWVCHYSAFRRGDVARRAMGDFGQSANPGLGYGRALPSEGLTVQQLLELLRAFDLPAKFYRVRQLPPSRLVPWAPPGPQPPANDPNQHPGLWDHSIIPICCRYLNSGFPVLVGTRDHAFVLCGWRREPQVNGPDWITFLRQDDQQGPYMPVGNIFTDADPNLGFSYSPWEYLIVPLPDHLWLPPEPAERVGGLLLQRLADATKAQVPEAGEITQLIQAGKLALKTYAISSNSFKERLAARGLDPAIVQEYRLARLSHFLWVVEAIDRSRRARQEPAVLGEVIFDATSSENDPQQLAIHVPGVAWVHRTRGNPRFPIRCAPTPYLSGSVGPM